MKTHNCPGCGETFNGMVEGMLCWTCLDKRDATRDLKVFEDSNPTRPMLIVPLHVLAGMEPGR